MTAIYSAGGGPEYCAFLCVYEPRFDKCVSINFQGSTQECYIYSSLGPTVVQDEDFLLLDLKTGVP